MYTRGVNDLLILVPTGLAVGLVGSLIGVGGGFFVVPFLMAFWRFDPRAATAASLVVVLLSALSGTAANSRKRRIDFRTGAALAAGTIPGAWAGRRLIEHLSVRTFSVVFATFLVLVALSLVLVKLKEGKGLLRGKAREITDSDGTVHRYAANLPAGFAASLVVGVVSSLFGVGGGLLLVPFMVTVYGAPILVATATAQFTFIFTSAAGVASSAGQFATGSAPVVALLGAGVVAGAQAGVAIAKKVRPGLVRGMIAAVIAAVAVLMFLKV